MEEQDIGLFEVVRILDFIKGQCYVVLNCGIEIHWPGRGKNSITTDLRKANKILKKQNIRKLENVQEDLQGWITNMDTRYSEAKNVGYDIRDLAVEDADELIEDIDIWNKVILDYAFTQEFETIKEISFTKFFPPQLRKNLDKNIVNDLKEGFELSLFNSPNPSAMISLRAAEGIIKNYYKSKGGDTENKNLNQIIDDLEKQFKVKKSLVGYLHFIRDKRNQSAHPGTIFSQEDSEEILNQVKSLLKLIK